MGDRKKPEWTPRGKGREQGYASHVLDGVKTSEAEAIEAKPRPRVRRRELSAKDYIDGVLARDRTVLARAITLVESNAKKHAVLAREVLEGVMSETGRSTRVGITGVPGVGKSTFIDALGMELIERGHKVAVLAVDPSSGITRGSILGDKTRMERLARQERCFIRPSPAAGTLGGVARKSRETMLLCEAAGFDVIFVETVGVGQSEVTVRSMVDFFLLLMIPGAGDELQGIKRGVMELADALVINKAEGENERPAQVARSEYERALHYLLPATEGWTTPVVTCSARTGARVYDVWELIARFCEVTQRSGFFEERRRSQALEWMNGMITEHLHLRFFENPDVKARIGNIETQVRAGKMPAITAVEELIDAFEK